jgi:hypothetical protein
MQNGLRPLHFTQGLLRHSPSLILQANLFLLQIFALQYFSICFHRGIKLLYATYPFLIIDTAILKVKLPAH